VADDRGIFLKIHHGQNASETPVTEDLSANRVPAELVALAAKYAPLYAADRVFAGMFADTRGYDAVADVALGYDPEAAVK